MNVSGSIDWRFGVRSNLAVLRGRRSALRIDAERVGTARLSAGLSLAEVAGTDL
jgi:hypothetical protein